MTTSDELFPTLDDLRRVATFGRENSSQGWRPRLRESYQYYLPEHYYEAVVDRLVTSTTRWLDVGGGKSLFPMSPALSSELAGRAHRLVALDPSENVLRNPYADSRVVATVEEAGLDEEFDLATLRMVAEHLPQPERAVASLARLVCPGGHVVIYTPHRWSPVSIASALTPSRFHHHLTGLLWNTLEEDVFPTCYRMNTRKSIRDVFTPHGFEEVLFAHLENCQILHRWQLTSRLELISRRLLNRVGIRYPETEILAVFRRVSQAD